jgi:hypothetical protein
MPAMSSILCITGGPKVLRSLHGRVWS